MARWAPARRDTIAAIADEIRHNYAHGRVIVAVDGAPGSGTGPFADDLASALRHDDHAAFVAALDDFSRPRAERDSDDSAAGLYARAYDYATLRRVLIDPFRLAGSTGFTTAAFDRDRDVPRETRFDTAPADAVLVVEGRFLMRPELRGVWNFSLWLDGAPFVDADPRVAAAQQLYEAEARPSGAVSAIVDNRDPDHPRRVFADSC